MPYYRLKDNAHADTIPDDWGDGPFKGVASDALAEPELMRLFAPDGSGATAQVPRSLLEEVASDGSPGAP
jgi:hypothetical protein